MSLSAQPAPTLDEQVRRIVNDAIASERERMAKVMLDVATKRFRALGPGDPIVAELTVLANAITDPAQ